MSEVLPRPPSPSGVEDAELMDELTLAELVNRVLDRGVALTGDIVISVAGVELVYLGLRAVLASTETLRRSASGQRREERP